MKQIFPIVLLALCHVHGAGALAQPKQEAAQIGERIRKRIERTEFAKRQVTVSIGIASCSSEIDTPKDLISAADVALYAAKNHGRNNVQIFNAMGDSITENIH